MCAKTKILHNTVPAGCAVGRRTTRAVELLKRTKNLRAVQQHRDFQSTSIYARLMPGELAKAVSAFDA